MSSRSQFNELRLLITECSEGVITPQRMKRLNEILASSKKARQYYYELIDIHVLTEHLCTEKMFFDESGSQLEDEIKRQDMLLQELAQEEIQADTIAVSAVMPSAELIRPKTQYPVPVNSRKINKSTIISFVMSAAAILLVVLFVQYVPPKLGSEVATMTDSLNAVWADNRTVSIGTRMATSYTPVMLKEGVIQLLFDNNTQVVIEAPAEFNIVSDDQIKLSYGMLFANVPNEAIGFTVTSQDTKIIDLGTEFGIYSDLTDGLELHVLKGKTLLFAQDNTGMTSVEVQGGFARKVTPHQSITEIPCKKRTFARSINSNENQIWRGQKTLDLTDMVTGGDGQNTHRSLGKIDLLSGNRTGVLYIPDGTANPGFQVAQENPFVDGVFIPDQDVSEIVTSTGIRFEQCPDTTGSAYYNISTIADLPNPGFEDAVMLSLSKDPKKTTGTMLLHANAGITYDLQAIRNAYNNYQVTSFTTNYGLPASLKDKRDKAAPGDSILMPGVGTVDFYVLIDGNVRQKISFRMPMEPQALRIPISDQNRFLSLITTDSNQSGNFDWFVLQNPRLVLEEK